MVKIALVSGFLEDEVYETRLNDKFIQETICNEDHFYHRIAKALMQNNLEPVVYYLSQEKTKKEFTHKYGHKIIRIPVKKIPFFHESIVYSPELVNSLKNDFDICHFVSGYYIKYKIPDMFDYTVSKLHKKMPIIARWAGGNHKWLFPIRKKIKKIALQRCDKIICSGEDETKVLQNVFNINEKKILKVMNPIDETIFRFREKKLASNKLGLEFNCDYLLYVGRFAKNKGIEQVLNVYNKLEKNNSDLKLILIGDGPLFQFVKDFVKKNCLEKKVILPGRLTHDIICYYYNISSILLNVGKTAGLPNVIIEAIASKLPIISTDAGASKEYVGENFKNGILIKTMNEEDIQESIIKILSNKERYTNSEESILSEFTFESFGKKLKETYDELLC